MGYIVRIWCLRSTVLLTQLGQLGPFAWNDLKTILPAGSLMQQGQHEVHPGQTWAFRTPCVAFVSLLGLLSHRLHTGQYTHFSGSIYSSNQGPRF